MPFFTAVHPDTPSSRVEYSFDPIDLISCPSYSNHSHEVFFQVFYDSIKLDLHSVEKLRKEKVMAKKGEVYKCDVCGNVVSVVQGGDGDLVCCGQNMRQLSKEEVSKL